MLQKLLVFTSLLVLLLAHQAIAQDCSLPNTPTQFKAKLAWQSTQDGPSTVATPVVANLNPQSDSIPEIIVLEGSSNVWNKIQFYKGDGSNAGAPMVLTVPGGFDNYPAPGPTIGDVNGDGIPELLISCADRRIRVYTNYTENLTQPMTLWITTANVLDFIDQRPLLADFDQDGTPEVYAGSDIYKFDFSNPAAPTLIKVINGLANQGQSEFGYYSEGGCNPTAVDILSVADCGGDPDGAGLELVAGPVIYSIDLDLNDGDGYQMKVQRNLNTMVPANIGYGDGYTSVADLDLDGVLDIVVTSLRQTNQFGMYVWNKNGFIRWFPYPNNPFSSGSLACIANVYDDTQKGYAVDFPEILICSSMNFTCYNLHAAQATPATPYWWNLPTSDGSGWTGSTVYDFNGDGISEIVYRDESNLRILYGGAAPFPPGVDAQRNWFKVPCFSVTSDEYAVVADVDNDGETEIAVTGRLALPPPGNFNDRYRGRLRVFDSDGSPWVPCRNVWNQYNYFIVNVNDDLTIPAVQQMHHLELPATGSGIRPFNTYLAQRPLLDENFQAFIPLPDAAATAPFYNCNQDSINLQVEICNTGKKTLASGTPVTFYQTNPTSTNAAILGSIQWTNALIQPDSCANFTFTLPKQIGNVFGVVNDDGSKPRPFQLAVDFPVTSVLECNFLNNIFQADIPLSPPPVNLGPDLGACQDTAVLLNAGTVFSSYLWQDGSTGSTFQTQQSGVFWVETTDHCALKQRDTVSILVFEKPAIQLDTINGDCLGNPAIVSALAQSSYLPLQYAWSSGDFTPSVSGLQDGNYTVTVTNAKGCTSTSSTWVEAGGNLHVSASVAAAIQCFGQTGALDLSFQAGNPPYVFQWSDGSVSPNLPNASAGNYAVTITDADHCADTLQITLAQPNALISNGLIALPSCPGQATGAADFQGAAQGTPPYNLLWSTNDTNPNLSNLSAGNYQLTLSDANGCSLTESVLVPAFLAPVTELLKSDLSCFGTNDGSAVFNILSGSPGFGFLWSNNETSAQITGLLPGNYNLSLTYADGACMQTLGVNITEPLPILLSGQSSPSICKGGLGGSIDLNVLNGVGPLSFHWSNNANSEDLTNVSAGAYQVTVMDAGGCEETFAQIISELPAISLNFSTLSPDCAGGLDGNIQLLPAGGTAPFQFLWSNGNTNAQLSGIVAGIYTATVTDAAACTEVLAVQLTEPTALVSEGLSAELACPGESNGSAVFLGVSQGTPPYNLLWSTNETGAVLSGLPAGNYQLTLTDAQGCSLVEGVQVAEFMPPTPFETIADISCFGSNNGSISISLAGGAPGFSYAWSSGQTTQNISNLGPGNYSLTLEYANGNCSQVFDYQVEEPTQLLISTPSITPVKCFGGNDGAIDLTTMGGVAPYHYQWSVNQTTEDLSGLLAGNYTLTLTDDHGCTQTDQFIVQEPSILSVTAIIEADTCQTASGSISLNPSGGVQPYLYNWSNANATPKQTDLAAGIYQLTLTDANACTELLSVQIPKYGELPVLSPFTNLLTCAQMLVNVGVVANQTNLHYTWASPNGTLPDLATQSISVPGLYQVTATNEFGCQSAVQMQVLEDKANPQAEAGPPALDVLCDESNALLSGAGSSQGNGFQNRWYGFQNGALVVDTMAVMLPIQAGGLYIHEVLNLTNGCSAADTILVNWDQPIAAVIAVDSIQCFGYANGKIELQNATGGTQPLLYSIDNLPFTTQNSFSGLDPGSYLLRIRDGFGCKWERTVVLTEPREISVELTANDTSIALGQSVQLVALLMPGNVNWATIEWEPKDFPYAPMSLKQRVKPETDLEFLVRITDQNGCFAEDRRWIYVHNHHIYVPNIILPGSESNSWFTVYGGDGVVEVRALQVFDRWGEQVFERLNFLPNSPELGWDGRFRGEALNPGVFVWYAEVLLEDGQVLNLKGDVTVAR